MSDSAVEKKKILVVDDDKNILRLIQAYLENDEYRIYNATDGKECFAMVDQDIPDVILLDLRIPGMDGIEVMKSLRIYYPKIPIIMMSAHGTIQSAVDAMQTGAYDFVTKPFDSNRLKVSVRNALERKTKDDEIERLQKELYGPRDYGSIVGSSPAMRRIYDLMDKIVASSNVTVLITGESGTGKELVAREIHKHDKSREKKPFVAFNCAAIPEHLLESELFGHEKGAFTGATERRIGKFEFAHGGTLFLDEIGEMSMATQAKLVRVIQEREVSRIGGNDVIKIDVRLISATNKNLEEEVKNGRFREDLFYRLSVFPIVMPSLRERKEDVALLATHFMEKFKKREKKENISGMSREVLELLMGYHWPGNVRELENSMERAMVLASGNAITLEDLPPNIRTLSAPKPGYGKEMYMDMTGTMEEILERVEEKIIKKCFADCDGNISEVARRLNIGRATIYRKAEKYGLPIKDYSTGESS
ncbi:sigma-54 dependent transcriptional regulator [bacterium]|nr:sigma-54 dependent transcriptional regulator [bacterium]NUN46549.1 sigma-54-dependent Fis family transcriptional regulator [bacterium]HMW34123.1 sigma-54 dependent transcriptional regulator [bacterium]HMY36096.1 sigma-54 dependent transcriptional regulator [bacterium]HMZ05319.1 sigma-54 dependent transcriptional regulator [bacterium]